MERTNPASDERKSPSDPGWSLRRIPEYWALGLFCIVVGLGAIWIARGYPYGTLTSMGPGFVPTAVAAILVVLGVIVILLRGSDVKDEEMEEKPAVSQGPGSALVLLGVARVLFFVVGGIVFFGFALRRLGMGISTFILVLLVSLARPGVKIRPVLFLAAGITIASYVIFILLLGLQIDFLPKV